MRAVLLAAAALAAGAGAGAGSAAAGGAAAAAPGFPVYPFTRPLSAAGGESGSDVYILRGARQQRL